MNVKTSTCRVCGCTDHDCRQCIDKTGKPCSWIEKDLCSACIPLPAAVKCSFHSPAEPDRKFTMTFTTELSPGGEKEQLEILCNKALLVLGLENFITTHINYTYNLNRSTLWPFI